MKSRIAIVVVNWNRKTEVMELLRSLRRGSYASHDVIVVDNASTDGSVDVVTKAYPDVQVIRNTENRGGTGGFNTGIRSAIAKGFYDFVWLLDNDAQVDETSLPPLIEAMQSDSRIGIAGSRIVDPCDKEITIEVGAFVRWNTIGVRPLFRNVRHVLCDCAILDVDYVAVCSALVRISALDLVGLMDERHFLFWDDMDWGLEFKRNGFRVVSVLDSVVYHPAFTEKRSPLVDYYYGNRNALLTYAKHAGTVSRISIFSRYLRHSMKVFIFLGVTGRADLMELGLRALWDFLSGKWGGKVSLTVGTDRRTAVRKLMSAVKKVIILNGGNKDDIVGALQEIRKLAPEAQFSLLIEDDRSDMFQKLFHVTHIMERAKQHRATYLCGLFLRVLVENYDIAVNPKYPSPFSFAAKKSCLYNPLDGVLQDDGNDRSKVWRLVLAAGVGEAAGFLILPLVYFRSLAYKRSWERRGAASFGGAVS